MCKESDWEVSLHYVELENYLNSLFQCFSTISFQFIIYFIQDIAIAMKRHELLNKQLKNVNQRNYNELWISLLFDIIQRQILK